MRPEPDINSAKPPIGKKFRRLLNGWNLGLWNDLNREFFIELEESPEKAYLTYFSEEVAIIEVDINDLDPSAFTHELLHVYLKAKGVRIIWDLKERINGEKDLRGLISTSLRVHIGNCLEHVKMLPIFLSLGFRNEDFLMDHEKRILDEEQMRDLEQAYYQNGKPVPAMVDKYIGKFFAVKASNNPDFDYSMYMERFEKLDFLLFHLNLEFWEAWKNYTVGEPREKYLPFLSEYLEGLKDWKKGL